MNVISVANHKGGVGKTTTTVNLAAALAQQGYKVLVIDLDPQANATFSLGLKKQDRTIYNVLGFGDPVANTIQQLEDLDIVPASIHLANFEKNSEVGKEFILREALEEIQDDYDFVIIDCPPSLGSLTISALTASNYTLIALQPETLALQGMNEFIKILRTVKTRMNNVLELLGILITNFDGRKILHGDVMEHARQTYGELVFDTTIRGNVALAECQSMGQHIFSYSPSANGAVDYFSLAQEVVRRSKELAVA